MVKFEDQKEEESEDSKTLFILAAAAGGGWPRNGPPARGIKAAGEPHQADTTHDNTPTPPCLPVCTPPEENQPENNPKRSRPPRDFETESQSSTSTMTWKKRISSWFRTGVPEKVQKTPEISQGEFSVENELPRLTRFTDSLRGELKKEEEKQFFQETITDFEVPEDFFLRNFPQLQGETQKRLEAPQILQEVSLQSGGEVAICQHAHIFQQFPQSQPRILRGGGDFPPTIDGVQILAAPSQVLEGQTLPALMENPQSCGLERCGVRPKMEFSLLPPQTTDGGDDHSQFLENGTPMHESPPAEN